MAESSNQQGQVLEIDEIMQLLPHRYPFLMIDRVTEIVPGERLVGFKNITYNEQFFLGHFPGRPVMPGVLILEGMAQAAGILVRKSPHGVAEDKLLYLTGAEDLRWKRPVVPGDVLRYEVAPLKSRPPLWVFKCEAYVGTQLAASATIKAAEVD